MSHRRPWNPLVGRLIADAVRRESVKSRELITLLETNEREITRIKSGQMPSERRLRLLCERLKIWEEVQRVSSMSASEQARELKRLQAGDVRVEGLPFARRRWKDTDFIKRLIQLVDHLIPKLSDEWRPPPDSLVPVYFKYEQTWRILVNRDDKIVGFWHFDPLTPEKYQRARSRILLDRELTSDALRSFHISGTYDVYIAFIGVLPDYDNAFIRLFSSFFEVLEELSRDNRIFIGSICANGLSEDGIALCRDLNMRKLGPHKKQGFVFEDKLVNILERLYVERDPLIKDFAPLLERYRSKFSAVGAC